MLQDVGLITHESDAFRRNRSAYRVAEPLIVFYHAVMRPVWGDLERPGRAPQAWQRVQPTFRSKVVGPHFEKICREWLRWYAAPSSCGGVVSAVGAGTVNDTANKTSWEVDAVAFGADGGGRGDLPLVIGEAKWNETMGVGHLRRLEHIGDLLSARKDAVDRTTRLFCFSGAGFTDELRRFADHNPTVQLVDAERLYRGD